jgi:hypothetical protein
MAVAYAIDEGRAPGKLVQARRIRQHLEANLRAIRDFRTLPIAIVNALRHF